MKATINRQPSGQNQTLGTFRLDTGGEVYECKTLELSWKNNQRRISCIPKGSYKVVPRTSEKFGKHFHITNVPGRSYILIHAGNYHTQILGCVLVGQMHLDINNDGDKDVTNSRNTLKKLLELAPNGFTLCIE